MATVAFSHFYKIPLVPKVTKFIFYNISSSLLTLSSQIFFGKTKVCLLWEKNIFLMGNQKWQKKIEFEKLKIFQNGQISGFGILNFSSSNFFVIFGFPSKIILFRNANILLSYQKHFEADSINREEDIL